MSELKSVIRGIFGNQLDVAAWWPYPQPAVENNETIAILIDSLKKFAKHNIDDVVIDQEHKIKPELLKGLGELGVLGLAIPEAYDGFGFTAYGYCKVMEELARISASVAITVGAHQSIGMKAIILFGNEQQKKKYLPKLATGEWFAAFALTEPGAGSDVNNMKSFAKLSDDGKHFILNGTKQWITNGGFAHVFTVFAKTDVVENGETKKKISAFIVTRDMGGITSGVPEQKLGIRGSQTTEVHFENTLVPVENLIGEIGHGFKIAMEVLNSGRLGLAAGCIGGCKYMLELAVAHADTRSTFDRKIHSYELIRAKLADMSLTTYAMESMVYLTTGLYDAGLHDFSMESAACKIYATEGLWECINHAIQIAGGNGYMDEYPYERKLRDSRINLIFEGTNEIITLYIGLSGLKESGDQLKAELRRLKNPLTAIPALLNLLGLKRMNLTLAGLPSELEASAKLLTMDLNAISASAAGLIRKHKKGIIDKQLQTERITRAVTESYTMIAVLGRATCGHGDIALSKGVCQRAHERISRQLIAIKDPTFDGTINQIAEAVVTKQGIL